MGILGAMGRGGERYAATTGVGAGYGHEHIDRYGS